MSTKQNLPNNPVTTANFTGEQGKMQELSAKYPRTTTGNLSYTSSTSGVVYNTATYDGGTYANQGEQGLFLVLQNALLSYIVFATDFNNKAETVDVGDKSSLTTTDKTNLVAAINEINAKGINLQNAFLMTDKAVAELLMIADVDSKVFSPNLNKFYTNFSTVMDYSMGTIDATKQTYTGTLSAGATNVVLPSATGFSAGQEISIQDGTNYEDIIVSSVVSTTVSFKTALVNSYTNPIVYRSNNNGTAFGDAEGGAVIPVPSGSVFGLHFNSNTTDFVGSLSPSSNTSTYDTTNKKFGSASVTFNGSQFIRYADSEIWNVGSDGFYVEFWVKKGENGTDMRVCGQTNSSFSSTSTSFGISSNSANLFVGEVYISGSAYSVQTSAVTNTNWHHIRFGRSANNIYIALDGIVSLPVAVSGAVNNSTNQFGIGAWGEYPTTYFNGNIDEFLLVKGQPMNTTNFTPPVSEYGTGVATTKNVIRMNIAPYEPVKYISAWLTKSELTGFTADGKVSIVASGADESYVDLTETVTDLGSTNEVQMLGSVTTPNPKVTLKVILNRASTSDSVSFTKLLGGVSA